MSDIVYVIMVSILGILLWKADTRYNELIRAHEDLYESYVGLAHAFEEQDREMKICAEEAGITL